MKLEMLEFGSLTEFVNKSGEVVGMCTVIMGHSRYFGQTTGDVEPQTPKAIYTTKETPL